MISIKIFNDYHLMNDYKKILNDLQKNFERLQKNFEST